jgi:O-acetyl-ADP-ribose deacetylase (regulator of RNase III)
MPSNTLGFSWRGIGEGKMKAIQYLNGDATSPQAEGNKVVAHICNDLGGWGKGFVLAVSRRWPEPEADYRKWHRERADSDFSLGAVQIVQVESEIWVANMVGQRGIKASADGPPIRYDAVRECLGKLGDFASAQAASVHMPRIGCGLAGGRWERVEPIIEATLSSRTVHDSRR